jgi:hypothetical protein
MSLVTPTAPDGKRCLGGWLETQRSRLAPNAGNLGRSAWRILEMPKAGTNGWDQAGQEDQENQED